MNINIDKDFRNAMITGAIVLGLMALRDGAAKGIRAYADYRKRKAEKTPSKDDDEREVIIGATLRGFADRLVKGETDSVIDELKNKADELDKK